MQQSEAALDTLRSMILRANDWSLQELGDFPTLEMLLKSTPPRPRYACPACEKPISDWTAQPETAATQARAMLERSRSLHHASVSFANSFWRPVWEPEHTRCMPALRKLGGWVQESAVDRLRREAEPTNEKPSDVQFRDVVRAHLTREDFDKRRFATFKDELASDSARRAKAALLNHVPAPGTKGIVLAGSTGVGKTHLLMALCMKLVREGHRCQWFRFADVVSRLRKAAGRQQGDEGESVDAIVTQLSNVDLLFVDDLGAEHGSPFVTAALLDALDTRLRYERPTYLTTNKSLDEIGVSYDARVASRIAGLCTIFEVTGKDVRRG